MRRVATLVGSFVALLCLALPAAPAAAASIPYTDLLASFQNVTSGGVTLTSGGTITDYSSPGSFKIPVTNATSTTLEHQGSQLIFTQGMTTLTLSDFVIDGLPSSATLAADVAVNGSPVASGAVLTLTFQDAATAISPSRYLVSYNDTAASTFNSTFGLNLQAGDPLGVIEFPMAVPEPAMGLLLGVGLAGALLMRRRRLAA